jgi:hypothetical protein
MSWLARKRCTAPAATATPAIELLARNVAIICGKRRSERAKMIGITPA